MAPEFPADISCIFSTPPEAPETRRLAIELQDYWRAFQLSFYLHLEYTLTYAATSSLHSAVLYCRTHLERFAVWIQAGFNMITSDSRYSSDVYFTRQRRSAAQFVFAEGEAMVLIRCCYDVATRIADEPCLDKLRILWLAALARSPARLRWIPVSQVSLRQIWKTRAIC